MLIYTEVYISIVCIIKVYITKVYIIKAYIIKAYIIKVNNHVCITKVSKAPQVLFGYKSLLCKLACNSKGLYPENVRSTLTLYI